MNIDWDLLSWDYCCSQAPGVDALHETAEFRAEYGCSWDEFINDNYQIEQITPLVQTWWDTLPVERKRELLEARKLEFTNRVNQINHALEELE